MSSAVPIGGSRRQKSSAGCGVALLWTFVIGWYGFLSIFVFVILSDRSKDATAPLAIVAIFAVAGLLVVYVAIQASANAARFRGTELELQSTPGVLGGRIAGNFRVPLHVLKLGPLDVHVGARKRYRLGDDSHSDLLWDVSERLGQPLMSGGDIATLPFSVRLPYDAEPSAIAASVEYYWTVQLQTPGGKSFTSFEVPVARTAQSSAEQTMATLRPAVTSAPAEATAQVNRTMNGVEITLPSPSWTWKWFAFLVTATAIAIAGANIILTRMRSGGMPPIYEVMTYLAITGGVLLLTALSLASLAMYVRRIRADRAGAEFTYAFPMRRANRMVREEIKDIAATYSQSSHTYAVEFMRVDNKPILGGLLLFKSKNEADWIATELRRAIFGTG